MKVGLVQQKNTADRTTNIRRLKVNIRKAAREGVGLVILQELHNGLCFCQTEGTSMFDLAEMILGPSAEASSVLTEESGIALVLSLFERRAPSLYHNTAVVLERNGMTIGKYRKIHIPDDPAYYEKSYSAPGDLSFEPISISVGRLGMLVYWDQWYPEAARLMTIRSAEMPIYSTAIGWESNGMQEEKDRQLGAWVTIQREHAVANGFPVISINRIGHKSNPSEQAGGIRFWGNSFATDPQSELLTVPPNSEEEVRVMEIDKTRGESMRHWWPFFRDRRTDAFGGLTK